MTIQVLLAGTDEAAIILLDDVNNESVLVPLSEIDALFDRISSIKNQNKWDKWKDEIGAMLKPIFINPNNQDAPSCDYSNTIVELNSFHPLGYQSRD